MWREDSQRVCDGNKRQRRTILCGQSNATFRPVKHSMSHRSASFFF